MQHAACAIQHGKFVTGTEAENLRRVPCFAFGKIEYVLPALWGRNEEAAHGFNQSDASHEIQEQRREAARRRDAGLFPESRVVCGSSVVT
jgi:hypothetical protein